LYGCFGIADDGLRWPWLDHTTSIRAAAFTGVIRWFSIPHRLTDVLPKHHMASDQLSIPIPIGIRVDDKTEGGGLGGRDCGRHIRRLVISQ